MIDTSPNYRKIFLDILETKYPEKRNCCEKILSKKELKTIDIIQLNQKIFDSNIILNNRQNQKHKSYDKSTILEMLDYQKKNHLNNSQLASHFKLSRNSVSKWRKLFLIS